MRWAAPYVDFATAMSCAYGTVLALYARRDTGRGQKVEGSLLRLLVQISGARRVLDAALAHAAELGVAVNVSVCDVAGHEIDKRHEGGREVAEIQQDCRTVQQTQSRIDGYTVEYLYKGQRHQVRMAEAPKDKSASETSVV